MATTGAQKNRGIQEAVQPEVFLPHSITRGGSRLIIMRSAIDPNLIVQAVRNEIHAVDRSVASTTIKKDEDVRCNLFSS